MASSKGCSRARSVSPLPPATPPAPPPSSSPPTPSQRGELCRARHWARRGRGHPDRFLGRGVWEELLDKRPFKLEHHLRPKSRASAPHALRRQTARPHVWRCGRPLHAVCGRGGAVALGARGRLGRGDCWTAARLEARGGPARKQKARLFHFVGRHERPGRSLVRLRAEKPRERLSARSRGWVRRRDPRTDAPARRACGGGGRAPALPASLSLASSVRYTCSHSR